MRSRISGVASIPILFRLVFLLNAGHTKTCPSTKECTISQVVNGKTLDDIYTSMCGSCTSNDPKFRSTSKATCESCLLFDAPCKLNGISCCPLKNGRSYCNANSGKCEASRFCDSDSASCPFDDLSAAEMKQAVLVITTSKKFPPNIKFPVVRSLEPNKGDWNAGIGIQRIAFVAVWHLESDSLSEVLVDLKNKKILKITQLRNHLPRIMTYEDEIVRRIVTADPRWQAAMMARNLNPEGVQLALKPLGSNGPSVNTPGSFIVKIVTNFYDAKTKYAAWRTIEGIIVTVNLVTQSVLDVIDLEITNLTSVIREYPNFSNKPKIKPLVITQREGTSIQVKGQEIQWYKWKLRYSVDPLHGLQLFHVRYFADCEERLVLYKISLGEVYVPYGGNKNTWRFRGYMDSGELGFGIFSNSLEIGVDLPENALRLPCVMASNGTGAEPVMIPGCVGVYELDSGILYRKAGSIPIPSRRGRQLVVTNMATFGNYDYAVDYILSMDGTLDVRYRLTGIMQPRGNKNPVNNPSCLEDCITLVADYLTGPTHQHIFNTRIDLDVEGVNNHVMEVEVENKLFGPENLDDGAFALKREIIASEGFRDYNLQTARTWQVVNVNSRNRFDSPRGYSLRPNGGSQVFKYLKEGGQYLPQVEFTKHPIWFTAYRDTEQSPVGDYPRSGFPGQGLPQFVQNQESIQDKDSVLWYTVGLTHSTRPEEWPLMDVHMACFSLVPYNFLFQNSEVPMEMKCPCP